MIDPRTELLLEDMFEYVQAAMEFVRERSADQFGADFTLILATTRAVEIVAEAAYQVDPKVQAAIPSLPWRDIIAMRHKLVHGYRKIDPAIIHETVRDEFPALAAELERLLNEGRKS